MKLTSICLLSPLFLSLGVAYASDSNCDYCKSKNSVVAMIDCLEQCQKAAVVPKATEPSKEKGSDFDIAQKAGWDIQYEWDQTMNRMVKAFALKKPKNAPFGEHSIYPLLGFSNHYLDPWFILLGPANLSGPKMDAEVRIGNNKPITLDLSRLRNGPVIRSDDFVKVGWRLSKKHLQQLRSSKELTIQIPTKEFGKVDSIWSLEGANEMFNVLLPSKIK